MKRILTLMVFTVFTIVALAFAAEEAKEELRPSQKLMRGRAGGLGLMVKSLDEKNFEMISQAAKDLAGETKMTSERLSNSEAQEITLAVSSLALDIISAAEKSNSDVIKAKLVEIKGKCDECHLKFRK